MKKNDGSRFSGPVEDIFIGSLPQETLFGTEVVAALAAAGVTLATARGPTLASIAAASKSGELEMIIVKQRRRSWTTHTTLIRL